MPRRTTRPLESSAADSLATLDPAALVKQVRSLLAEAQALSARLAALNEVAVAMQAELDMETILRALTREARWILDFQYSSIALCDATIYHVQMLLGDPSAATDRCSRPIGSGAIGRALLSHHALVLHAIEQADEAPEGMQSALIIPLRSSGENIGTLNFYARAPRHYTQDDLRIASALAVQVAVMLQNVHLFTQITRARDELSTVLESIGDAVLVIDPAGRVLLLNTALRHLLLLPDCNFAGRRALWLCRLGRLHDRPLLSNAVIHELAAVWQAQPADGGRGMLQLSDGRHLEWAYAPLLSAGAVAGGVLTFRDISDRIVLEQLRDDMLHMLVHDLRTPLTGLIMGLDLLAMPGDIFSPTERPVMLERTRRAAYQLLEQVSTILDVSKLEAGRLELDREATDIAKLIDQALLPILPLAEQEQQDLVRDIAAALPLVALDARLIQRVVENLVGNALKFTPSFGSIRISARLVDAASLEIAVEDSGPGVPEELRAHIFEKYGQVPGEMRRRGTGLGLAFCKLVVEAHAGRISVRTAPAGGSIFWLRLPIM